MKPPFAYYGGKGTMADWIASLIPEHDTYIEPFAGSAAVLLAKTPATHEVLNDVNGDVVNFFRVLRDRRDELELACRLTPYARDEFQLAQAPGLVADDLEQARRFWVVVNQSFNKSTRAKMGWSGSTRPGNGLGRTVQNRIERFGPVAERLAGVMIENRDALEVIATYAHAKAVLYLDPPYLDETRVDTNSYGTDMGSSDSHRGLAEVLHDTEAAWLLSGYDSPLYEELYGDCHRIERSVLRRTSNMAGNAQPHALEVIWSNRPLDEGRLEGIG